MLNLILLANLVSSSCDWGVYDNPSGSGCLPCNSVCGDCTGPSEFECTQCASGYSNLNYICVQNCPLGFSKSGELCTSLTSDGVAYSLDFTSISNSIKNKVGLKSGLIVLSAGSTNDFYPKYDEFDPYTIRYRGFFFDGSAYLKNNAYEVTFGSIFTVATWIRPMSGSGYLFAKQTSANMILGIKIQNYVPTLEFYLSSLETFTSSNSFSQGQWGFLMVKMTLSSSYKAKISITVNGLTSSSSEFSAYFKDVFTNFYTTYAARYAGSSYSDYFTGYMWSFMIGNQDIPASTFIETSGCTGGCSMCPKDNSKACLSLCKFNQYIESGECKDCRSNCQVFGCVRNDKSCNLCYDRLCLNCETFEAGCTLCIKNAYLESSIKCVCNNGYIWDEEEEMCKPCVKNCKTCNGGGYLGCSECKVGNYMLWGVCYAVCPTGYVVSGNECVLSGSKRILDMIFNQVQGVVYDTVNKIPAVTGTSSVFYPNYETNDPIAAYSRGYYFRGNSIMNFAPYSTYTSPFLIFSSVFYVGIWFNPSEPTGILFSSVNPSYNIILQYSIQSLKPRLIIGLYSLVTEDTVYPSISCSNLATLKAWNYILFKLTLTQKGRTFITCYINKNEETSQEAGNGYLFDTTNSNLMLAGTQKTSAAGYDSAYYKGFIFHIVVDVDIDFPNKEISSTCTGGCPFCTPGGSCLPDCEISEYQSGSGYSDCSSCNSNCKDLGCRDNSDTCNICGDQGCKVCSSYSVDDCSEYNCALGKYKDPGSSNCLDCDISCQTCRGPGPVNCLSCSPLFLLNKACHSFCPTGYSSGSNKCTQSMSKILSLNLLQIKGQVPESQNNFVALAGLNSNFYPNFDANDPWPQISRGYYFNGASYLQLPPNSANSNLITLGNAWVISFWIRAEKDGIVVIKQNPSFGYCLRATLTGNKLSLDLQLGQLASVSSLTSLGNIWNYVIIRVRYETSAKTSVQVITNGVTENLDAGSGAYADLQTGFSMTVGAQKSSGGYLSFFTGFLYSFDIYSNYADISDYTSTCDKSRFSCTVCPSSTSACIDLCNSNQWFTGSQCQQCQASTYNSCRRNDKSCNLCKDLQCKVCDTFDSGSCTECRPNAGLANGECDCSDGYVWDNSQEACVVCDSSTKVKLQGVCLSVCPTGYTASSGKCSGTPSKIFNIQMDKLIQPTVTDTINKQISVLTGLTNEFYPYYDDEDPYAGKDRGYYYNGYSSYMQFVSSSDNSKQLVLSPEFSIFFWIYPVSSGVIFTKQSGFATSIKIEILESKQVKVSALLSSQSGLSTMTSSQQVVLNDWNFLGVTCLVSDDISTQITIRVNNNQQSQTLGAGAYVDPSSSYSSFLGAELNSSNLLTNYYTGYINSMTVWNSGQDLSGEFSTTCTGGCSICPTSGVCLPDCGLSSFYDSSACKSCNSFCKQGCVRNEDCNLCNDRLCELCSDYSSTGCSKCVDGAQMVSGVCQCKTGTAKTKPNGNLYCTADCQSECESCFSSFEGDCITCKDGFFLDVTGICVSQCQTGSSTQGKKCVQDKGKAKILHYVFNTTVNSPEDRTAKLKAFMGSTSQYIGNYDQNDPKAYYGRGIYFDGLQKYVQLPPNPSESTNVVLGNTHSIKVWLRPKPSSSSGTLAVKESSTGVLIHLLLQGLAPKVSYMLRDIYSTSSKTLSFQTSSLTPNVWSELVFVLKRSGRTSVGIFYLNGNGGQKSFITKSYLDEGKDFKFKLGYSMTESSSYLGFMYEFVIFNYEVTPKDPSTNPCWCSLCTSDGDCLSNCDFSQYIKADKTCSDCPGQCPSGCRSDSNCGQNEDSNCEEYSGFEMKQCTKCKKLSKTTASGCKCVENSSLVNGFCTCNANYEDVDNTCQACFYHLKSSEVEGHFSEDYLSIIFNMSQAVQSSTSSDCSKLFTSDSLSLLGDSPSCVWLNGFTILSVLLGFDAQVLNGTQIWFARNSLLSNTKTCGSFRGPINQTVYFKFEVPKVFPFAQIDAPFQYAVHCGDLVISGTRSTGGYGRRLKFEWQFVSKPYDETFNVSQKNLTSYLFENNSVSAGQLTVSLQVKNWLEFSSNAQQLIRLSDKTVIDLTVDMDINWQMTTQMSKSIFVQASSACGISNNLTYEWSLKAKEGKDSRIDQESFWGSQNSKSKLYIPKGALGPGRYSFHVAVHDNELDIDGETIIVVQVVYSQLQIRFNPEYKTVNRLKDLLLDGSVAFDPDQTTETSQFLWNCSKDCDSLIENSKKQVTLINKNNLENLREYQFTLSFTKGSRSVSAILTVQVNDSSKISVNFNRLPEYINNQENFIIVSSLDPPCNCSYFWQVLSGGSYKLNTEPTGKDLGFVPYSMVVGSKYKVQLTVYDSDGSESRFQQQFKVNVPAKGGSLKINYSKGSELSTWFKIQAPGWSDVENSTWPLTYQFGYYKGGQAYYVNVRNESSSFFTKLPADQSLQVFVRVYDIHGSFSEKTLAVQVDTSSLQAEDLIEEFFQFINSDKFDSENLVGYLTNLALTFQTHDFNETYKDSAFNLSVLAIETLKDTIEDIDFSKMDVLFSLTMAATLYDLDYDGRLQLYQLLTSFTQVISDESVIMSSARANLFVSIMLKLIDFSPSTVEDSAEDLHQVNEILKALAMASSVTMAQTQWMVYGETPIQSYLKLYKGDEITNFETPAELNSTLIALPADPSLLFLSSSTIMTVLTVYNWDPSLYSNNTKEHSAAVEFTLIEIVNSTQTVLDIQLEDTRINVSIPVWNVDKFPPKCVYWRTDSWSRKGCKLLAFQANRSICGCSHTSLYTSGSHFGLSSGGDDDDGGPILIYLVCLVALLWILLACCLVVKDRKESESKVFVAKIIAGLPAAGKKTPGFIENKVADQLGRLETSERKDTLHVPPAKFTVLQGEVKEYESQKVFGYSENEEPKSEDAEVRGRKLTLPVGYQILPGAEFAKTGEAGQRNERIEWVQKAEKPERYEKIEKTEKNERVVQDPRIEPGKVYPAPPKPDLPESEKAAGFSQRVKVSEFSESSKNPGLAEKDVEKAPTGPGFARLPLPSESPNLAKSEITSGSSSKPFRPESKENPGAVVVQVNPEKPDFSYSESGDGFVVPKVAPFDGFNSNQTEPGRVAGPPRVSYKENPSNQVARLGGVTTFEFGKESRTENRNISYAASRDLKLTEFEQRPGTDGKFLVQNLSGTSSNPEAHLQGVTELNLDDSPGNPDRARYAEYSSAPKLPGLTELNMESSEGFQRTVVSGGQRDYNPAPRLVGLTEMNLDDSPQNVARVPEPKARLQGPHELNIESIKGNQLAGQTYSTSSYRLAAPNELKILESQNFASNSKVGQPDPVKISLESPNFESEKKPFLYGSERDSKFNKSSGKGFKDDKEKKSNAKHLNQDFDDNSFKAADQEKRNNERLTTQPSDHKLFKASLEEEKQNIEKAHLKSPADTEKYPENTELFTQPDSPNHRHLTRRKKGADQEAPMFEESEEIRYPGFIADYFFSAILYYHENYSRFSRCAQGVSSFLLQTILIGVILSGMGSSYAEDKGRSFGTLLANLMFQDVAVAFSMVIVSNLLLGALLCLFFRRPTVVPGSEVVREGRKRELVGLFIMLLIIFGTVIAVALLEMTMDHMFSVLWVICLFIGFLFDFFCIQMVKVLIFNYFSPSLILPVS